MDGRTAVDGVVNAPRSDVRERMERMYRPQKAIYDLTRKYYLIGRDTMIEQIAARPGETIVDVGCGTGRNLAMIARRYPQARAFGLDPSRAMLEVAQAKLARAGLDARVRLGYGTAEDLDPQANFGIGQGIDHIVFSYSLSMIDDPLVAIDRALACLAPRGRLHIVDFGPMDGMPAFARHAMVGWLDRFGVHYKPMIEPHLRAISAGGGSRVERWPFLGGYAQILRLMRN